MSNNSSLESAILKGASRAKVKALVNLSACTGCEACIAVCPSPRCIERFGTDPSNSGVFVNYKACIGCGICAKDCPWETVSMVPTSRVLGHATSLESQNERSHPVFENPDLVPPEFRSLLRKEARVNASSPAKESGSGD